MTPPDIINALGGPTKVAQLCGLKRNSVCNWKTRGIPKAWMHKIAAEAKKVGVRL